MKYNIFTILIICTIAFALANALQNVPSNNNEPIQNNLNLRRARGTLRGSCPSTTAAVTETSSNETSSNETSSNEASSNETSSNETSSNEASSSESNTNEQSNDQDKQFNMCTIIGDLIVNKDIKKLLKLTGKKFKLVYTNVEMPMGGVYRGKKAWLRYSQRAKNLVNITNLKYDILGSNPAAETCYFRLHSSGSLLRNNKEFKDFEHYLFINMYGNKMAKALLTDGRTYKEQMDLYRTKAEKHALNFANLLHTKGPDSSEIRGLINPDAKFTVVSMGLFDEPKVFHGPDGYNQLHNEMRTFNSNNHLGVNLNLPLDLTSSSRSTKVRIVQRDDRSLTALIKLYNFKTGTTLFKKFGLFARIEFDDNGRVVNAMYGPLQPVFPGEINSVLVNQ